MVLSIYNATNVWIAICFTDYRNHQIVRLELGDTFGFVIVSFFRYGVVYICDKVLDTIQMKM